MIAIGCCPNSNGIHFYIPIYGTIVLSIEYLFQHTITSGKRFGYQYQRGIFIYRLDESTSVYAPKFALDSRVLVHIISTSCGNSGENSCLWLFRYLQPNSKMVIL
jgi:hypothetical protein